MPVYRKSEITAAITLAKPITTTTTIEVKGADDNFTTDRREFSSEEEVRINGSVTATDKANLSTTKVEVYLDNIFLSDVSLAYDSVTGSNNYNYSLGMLVEGVHNIKVTFKQFRLYTASLAEARIGAGLPPVSLWQAALIILGVVAGGAGIYYVTRRR